MRDIEVSSRSSRRSWLRTWGSRAALLSVTVGVFGVSMAACSSEGVTPTCSEAQLFANRYDEDDRAEHHRILHPETGKANPEDLRVLVDNADQDDAKLAQLAKEKCVTAPGAIGTGSSSGGSSGSGGSAGAAGSN